MRHHRAQASGCTRLPDFQTAGPESSLQALNANSHRFLGTDPSDLSTIHSILAGMDGSPDYSVIGGALAFAVTIASTESAARAEDRQIFEILAPRQPFRFPFPLGNILGGGAHAGPGDAGHPGDTGVRKRL